MIARRRMAVRGTAVRGCYFLGYPFLVLFPLSPSSLSLFLFLSFVYICGRFPLLGLGGA